MAGELIFAYWDSSFCNNLCFKIWLRSTLLLYATNGFEELWMTLCQEVTLNHLMPRLTVSQSCRDWEGPLEIMLSNTANAGSWQLAAQESIQAGPKYVQRRRCHISVGSLVQCCYLQSEEKFPLYSNRKLKCVFVPGDIWTYWKYTVNTLSQIDW